uniref:BAR domain-containing protein n=1 Tax=Eptatretus burgeri TaxID=7764 RepID=A0A8C4PXP7_EPTBU
MSDFLKGMMTQVNKGVQMANEAMGQAQKTELDQEFVDMFNKVDTTKILCDNIIAQVEVMLECNLGAKFTGMVSSLIKKENGKTNFEILGQILNKAGTDVGADSSYGGSLIKCGDSEQKIGALEAIFKQEMGEKFLKPFQLFLSEEYPNIMKERRILEGKRLELDSCRATLKKSTQEDDKKEANEALRKAQMEYDGQFETTKILLQGLKKTHVTQEAAIKALVDIQMKYHSESMQCLNKLSEDLKSGSSQPSKDSRSYKNQDLTLH